MNRRAAALSLSAVLALGGVAACGDDEDGDADVGARAAAGPDPPRAPA